MKAAKFTLMLLLALTMAALGFGSGSAAYAAGSGSGETSGSGSGETSGSGSGESSGSGSGSSTEDVALVLKWEYSPDYDEIFIRANKKTKVWIANVKKAEGAKLAKKDFVERELWYREWDTDSCKWFESVSLCNKEDGFKLSNDKDVYLYITATEPAGSKTEYTPNFTISGSPYKKVSVEMNYNAMGYEDYPNSAVAKFTVKGSDGSDATYSLAEGEAAFKKALTTLYWGYYYKEDKFFETQGACYCEGDTDLITDEAPMGVRFENEYCLRHLGLNKFKLVFAGYDLPEGVTDQSTTGTGSESGQSAGSGQAAGNGQSSESGQSSGSGQSAGSGQNTNETAKKQDYYDWNIKYAVWNIDYEASGMGEDRIWTYDLDYQLKVGNSWQSSTSEVGRADYTGVLEKSYRFLLANYVLAFKMPKDCDPDDYITEDMTFTYAIATESNGLEEDGFYCDEINLKDYGIIFRPQGENGAPGEGDTLTISPSEAETAADIGLFNNGGLKRRLVEEKDVVVFKTVDDYECGPWVMGDIAEQEAGTKLGFFVAGHDDGNKKTAVRNSKSTFVGVKKQGKPIKLKINVKNDSIPIKNGFEYCLSDDIFILYSKVVLPYNAAGTAKEPIISSRDYKPVKKVDENPAMFTNVKIKEISIYDLVEKPSDGLCITVRKAASVGKAATAVYYDDGKKSYSSVVNVEERDAAPYIEETDGGYFVKLDEKQQFVLPRIEAEGVKNCEYLIVDKADYEKESANGGWIDFTKAKWSKCKTGTKLKLESSKSKYALKGEDKASDHTLSSDSYVLIRKPGATEKDRDSGGGASYKLASQNLVAHVTTVTENGEQVTVLKGVN